MPQEINIAELDLAQWVRPGDTIAWSQGTGEPMTLTEALVHQRHAIGQCRAFLGSAYSKTLRPEHADAMSFIGMGAVGNIREFCKAGLLDVIPCHLSQLPWMLAQGLLKIDVMLVQVSPEHNGRFSLGAINSYATAFMAHARVVIAEVNAQTPWTHSGTVIDASKWNAVIRTDRPMIQMPAKSPDELEYAIARHVVPLVPEGAVLQVGIGTLPNAVLAGLSGHRNLGIHSGVMGDNILTDLIETGVVNNSTKPFDKGVTVTGSIFGTDRLYRYAHRNPALRVEPVEYTHNLGQLAQFESFVTINSAIEVDLTGQVNGETAGREYLGTVGGQTDFTRGAFASPKGRAMVILSATVPKNGASRIVAQLGIGVTTTARADADVIATEFGVAELRGRSIRQRVRAMIAIAHPDHRESLEREAHARIAGFA
jgi:acyl-CoA hydrolase